MQMGVFPACVPAHHVCVLHLWRSEECWVFWNWGYRQWWAIVMWMLGIQPGSSARAESALK